MADLQRIVVVGASLAGLNAAEALRGEGYAGTLTLVGQENHLPYDRPPLSKQVLAGEWEPGQTALRKDDAYDALDLDLRLGRRATGLDTSTRTVQLDDGEPLPYDGLIIATGSTPRVLPGTPDLPGIHSLRTLDDCMAIRAGLEAGARVVVVGAGFIGAEVAATARRRGLDVTLLEALPVPLSRALGEEMGRECAQLHLDHGVDLRCGVGVEGFDGGERVERVRLSDGSTVDADLVVVGVGVEPVTGWLQSSGLTLDGGIVCDATCQAAPGVYAAGDVARWHNPRFDEQMRVEHWTNAVEQGFRAGSNLISGPEQALPYAPVPYFWSDQYGTRIQFAGHAGAESEVRVVERSTEEGRLVALYGRAGRLVAVLAFNAPRRLRAYQSLIEQRATWDEALEHAAASG